MMESAPRVDSPFINCIHRGTDETGSGQAASTEGGMGKRIGLAGP